MVPVHSLPLDGLRLLGSVDLMSTNIEFKVSISSVNPEASFFLNL